MLPWPAIEFILIFSGNEQAPGQASIYIGVEGLVIRIAKSCSYIYNYGRGGLITIFTSGGGYGGGVPSPVPARGSG